MTLRDSSLVVDAAVVEIVDAGAAMCFAKQVVMLVV